MAGEKQEPGIYFAVASCWEGGTIAAETAIRFGPDETVAQDASLGALSRERPPKDGYVEHGHWFFLRVPDELVEQAYKDLVARREAVERAKAAMGGLTPLDPDDCVEQVGQVTEATRR